MKDGVTFSVEVLDTWSMTITPVPGLFTAKKRDNYYFEDADKKSGALSGRPYMAIRIRRTGGTPVTSPPIPSGPP